MATELDRSQETFRKWYQRIESNLEDFADAADERDRLRDIFDERLTNHGNSEEKLAVSQEGRELIELIQNARDAIREGDPDARQVYVGIFDHGLLVANTGKPFDLRDDDTERAVKMVGESNKADGDVVDLDSDTIGHIGVGLKSTLSVGDSFEIWTRLEDATLPLRVRYSRSYITAAIAARFGHDVPCDYLGHDLIGPYEAAVADGLFEPSSDAKAAGGYPLLDDLGKVPLFWYPWPLDPQIDPEGDEESSVSNTGLVELSNQLLTDPASALQHFDAPPTAPFQTAVFIEYKDNEWRDLLTELGIPSPENLSPPANPADHADELWQTLAYANGRSGGFDPETLLHLGEIEHLYMERVRADDASTADREFEHWAVEPGEEDTAWPDAEGEPVEHRVDAVKITAQGKHQHDKRFDRFVAAWPEADETKPRILLERGDSSGPDPERQQFEKTYPLYLYYPISSTRGALPFCLHGRFKVTTERKDLSQNGAAQNRAVIEDTAKLVGHIAKHACRLMATHDQAYWARFPWLLLPEDLDEDDEVRDDPRDTEELLEYLRFKIYEELTNTACLPTTEGAKEPAETILYPSAQVIDGFAAGIDIAENQLSNDDLTTTGESSLLTSAGLRWAAATVRYRRTGTARCRTLTDDPEAEETFDQWADWLADNLAKEVNQHSSSVAEDAALAVTVPAETARTLFQSAVALLQKVSEETDMDVRAVVGKQSRTELLDGVYLLPCARASDDEHLDLVALETRSSEDIQEGRSLSRTVVWDLNRDDLSMEFPPEDADFDFFFFDSEAESGEAADILNAAGRERVWGVHKYDGPADLFEALLERFTHSGNTIDGGRLAAFAQLLRELGSDSSRFDQDELAFVDRETLKATTGSEQKRNDVRTRLGVRRATLHLGDDFEALLADTTLNDEWQRLRADAFTTAAEGEEDTDDETRDWKHVEPLGTTPLPALDDQSVWSSVPAAVDQPDEQRQLAKTLSLLGASTLPGLRFIPLYDHLHPSFKGQSRPHWHPQEWKTTGHVATESQQIRDEIAAVLQATTYEQWLQTASYRAETGVAHSKSCDGNPSGMDGDGQSYLVNWAWIAPDHHDAYIEQPETVLELFRRYGETYVRTFLTTHWYCQNYDRCTTRDQETVPTVANHQLRHMPVWDDVVDVSESLQDAWDDQGKTLDCAVLGTPGGREGWRLFPYINPEKTDIPPAVFEAFGVTHLDDIPLAEAEYRLQRVQEVLAATDSADELVTMDEPVELSLPSAQRENWKRAYTLLLQPIMQYCRDHDSDNSDVVLADAFTFLDRLPLKRGDTWVTASIEWIQRHGGETVWRFPEESPPRWVEQELENEHGPPDCLLEYPIIQTGFRDFADLLGVEPVTAEEPTLSRETFEELHVPTAEVLSEDELEEWQNELERRLPLLLAILETRREDRLNEMAARVETAIQNISFIRCLPEDVENDLSVPQSVTVTLPDDVAQSSSASQPKGLAVNLDAVEGDSPTYGNLAMGFALLTEQYRSVSIFQRVLDPDTRFESLKESLKKETFPVKDVLSFLQDRKQKDLQSRLEAGRELLAIADQPQPSADAVMRELADLDQEPADILDRLAADITASHDVGSLPDHLRQYIATCRDAPSWIRETLGLLFRIKDTNYNEWRNHIHTQIPENKQSHVIDWLRQHESELPVELIDRSAAHTCRRLQTVWRVWVDVDDDFLETASDWRDPVESYSRTGIPWADELPQPIAEAIPEAVYWFDLAAPSVLADAADHFQQLLIDEALSEDTAERVHEFVMEGTPFPEEQTEQSRDHKNRAFSEAREHILETGVDSFVIQSSSLDDIDSGEMEGPSTTGGGGAESGPTSFIGRGEQAEVAVTINILQQLTEWIEGNFASRYEEFCRCLQQLYDDQRDASYQWHTKSKWEQELLDALDTSTSEARRHFLDWETLLDEGKSPADLLPVRLLDVSGEQGPGFDIIDPFGSSTPDHETGKTLDPVPVEIKAVDSPSGPSSIRLTTNEYQQCKQHITADDHPYSLRLVYVPTEGVNRVRRARYVGKHDIWDEDDLQQLIGDTPFDMSVRSGYLRFTLSNE